MTPLTCAACGLALFSDGAVYGPRDCPLCIHCFLTMAELLRTSEALDRATDILVDKQIDRELYEALAEQHLTVLDELAPFLPARRPRRGIGPMLPLGGE